MRVIASARTYRRSRLLSFGTLTRFLATPYRAKRGGLSSTGLGATGAGGRLSVRYLSCVMIFLLFPGVGVIIISAPGRL